MKDLKECKNRFVVKYGLLQIICICLICSCAQDKPQEYNSTDMTSVKLAEDVNPREYLKLMKEMQPELTVSQEIDKFKFSATYIPVSYQALLSSRGQNYDDSMVKDFVQKNKDDVFFIFRIANTKIVNKDILKTISDNGNDYYKILDYFSFRIQDDLKLIIGEDTLPCILSHYERGYDVRPDATFMLAFDKGQTMNRKKSDSKDIILTYIDKLSGSGRLNFRFLYEKIISLPVLKIK